MGLIAREEIAKRADQAAQRSVKSGRIEANDAMPAEFAHDSEAGRIYAAAFQRQLLKHSCPDVEGAA